MRRDYQNRLFANKANLFFPAPSGKKRVLLPLKVYVARANLPVARGSPKNGICSRQACLERSRKDAKNAKSGSLISLRPLRRRSGHALRLCAKYSDVWLRLWRTASFAVYPLAEVLARDGLIR